VTDDYGTNSNAYDTITITIRLLFTGIQSSRRDPGIRNPPIPNPGIEKIAPGLEFGMETLPWAEGIKMTLWICGCRRRRQFSVIFMATVMNSTSPNFDTVN